MAKHRAKRSRSKCGCSAGQKKTKSGMCATVLANGKWKFTHKARKC